MRRHRPETQTLYAQLLEAALADEAARIGVFATGLPVERTVRNTRYLYWQLRSVDGTLRQVYLGPADDETARALRDALVVRKRQRAEAVADLRGLTAAYVASGGAHHQGSHFKIVDALARAGVFQAGAVLVGSHAFVSIGAALGISWSSDTAATADVDLCRDDLPAVACDELQKLDLPGALARIDPSFFLVPELDLRAPSTSLKSRRSGVKVDLLTVARTPRDHGPRPIDRLGFAGQPLRHMDYLVRREVGRGLFIGPHAVVVNLPDPGRFAWHKLAVASRREGGAFAIKADKDRRQAAALIEALADMAPGQLSAAARAAREHPDRVLLKDIRASLPRLPSTIRGLAEATLGR